MEMLSVLTAGLSLYEHAVSAMKPKEEQREVRMCVLGLDNAGKTTILKALSHEEI